MFTQISQITEGHYNELTRKENDLYAKRIEICEQCPLYSEGSLGPVCDRNKNYGGTHGCGCRLNAKARVPSARCVLKKW